jgi:formylglycine-generating enzyme required for sulfatase activity
MTPVHLPLEPLFDLLRAERFDLSPATQRRAWEVLAGIGRDPALHNPAALKWLLAPVFARSADEQQRFYTLFDRYVEQVTAPQYVPRPLTRREQWSLWCRENRKALLWTLLAMSLPILGYFTWRYWPKAEPQIPNPAFEIFRKQKGVWVRLDSVVMPPEKPKNAMVGGGEPVSPLYEGDTLRLRNTTAFRAGQDSSAYRTKWVLALESPQGAVLNQSTWETVLHFPKRAIKLGRFAFNIALKSDSSASKSIDYSFVPTCATPPRIPALTIPQRLQPGQKARVSLREKAQKGLKYDWQISGAEAPGNRTQGTGLAIGFTVDTVASLQISLTLTDTTQPGQCRADTSFAIPVGDERVRLPLKTLEYDPITPEKRLNWASWLLLALAALGAGWYWWRWMRRKAPEPDWPVPNTPDMAVETASSDRPPYYIPWREADKHLRPAREQYRLADALRLRQQTEDQTLDFMATLRATLERGGYPTLRYRTRTRPTEYLFMVDEQLPGHHQARLFRHVAETLRGQDVVLEMVWYDPDLRRCWGPDLPQSIPLEHLRRYFPQHRLVLMGTGHALLDELADTPRLRPGMGQWLNAWSQRLLLTPQPATAWNWREAVLYAWFGVYPADLRGLLDAATFVEGGLDSSDLPARFEDWKARQCALRPSDANPDYQQWRTVAQHDAYLAPYGPELRRWWLATAVHPDPEWEVTLAIGRALSIAPTHDRLLALARIPALREGRLHPGLRRAMLLQLPAADEQAARTAVLEELEAIQELTEGSHVAEETQNHLAVQAFLLQPSDPDRQAAIAALLDADLLPRTQEDELNLFAAQNTPARKGDDTPPKGDIRRWLADNRLETPEPPPAEVPKRPFYTPDLWKAVACTALLALFGLAAGWLLQGEARRMDPSRDQLHSNPLVRERWAVDSALLAHNHGVELGTAAINKAADRRRADSLFSRALALRGAAYPLAQHNQVRNLYNMGVETTGLLTASAFERTQAAARFEAAAQTAQRSNHPADRLDALHGAGVAWFYAAEVAPLADVVTNRQGRARSYCDTLRAAGYFDTLRLRPNLQTLLALAGLLEKTANTPPDTLEKQIFPASDCLILSDAAPETGFRNRILTIAELREMEGRPNGPLARRTLIRGLKPGESVTYIGSEPNFWKVRIGNTAGYVAKSVRGKPTLIPCIKQVPVSPDPANTPPENTATPAAVIAAIERAMIPLPAGTFRMGSDDKDEDASDREKPAHDVTLRAFWMGRTEVTIAQYLIFCDETKANYPEWLEPGNKYHIETGSNDYYKQKGMSRENKNHPVTGVSWDDAVAYCRWLSQKTGKNYRLPTEAEWEYAARGGPKWTDGYKYAGSNNIDEVAWYSSNAGSQTHAVAGKRANQLGLYDMSGNVWEWCADWYGSDYYKTSPKDNPTGPTSGSNRVQRGGSWLLDPQVCRVAYRDYSTPDYRNSSIGFRLLRAE